jgi:DNA-binding NtrC family response regulator
MPVGRPRGPCDRTTEAVSCGVLPPLRGVIRIEHDQASPREFLLNNECCRIGSAVGNDIVVRDATVSRVHAEFELVAEGVAVRDLGSRNGIYYFGQRVERAILSFGTTITLGKRVPVHVELDATDLVPPSGYLAPRYGALVGCSPAMRSLFATLHRLDGSLVTVLIEGETGTGKELIARALHDHSRVADGPFVAINCGALDRALARGELFGHRRGAFTGAHADQIGAVEEADRGTLFLDEIGELPKEVQPVLLRFLETRMTSRVGDSKERSSKVRVIAATNCDLADEVATGRFRRDLYHRLAVVKIRAPSLSGRREDIEVLARHFAEADGFQIGDDLVAALCSRSWPGNVRELKNAIETFILLGSLPVPEAAALEGSPTTIGDFLDTSRPYAELKDRVVRAFTRQYLEALLAETGGNQSEAARRSGLQRGYLGRLLAKMKIAVNPER